MDSLLIILVGVLIGISLVILYFQLKAKPKQEDNPTEKIQEEINNLKDSFNQSFGSMSKDIARDFSASFGTMTKEIAKDMSGALTKVDEKVSVFNQQVSELNKSQDNFSRILAVVNPYVVLAVFSLASLLIDLFPSSQFI